MATLFAVSLFGAFGNAVEIQLRYNRARQLGAKTVRNNRTLQQNDAAGRDGTGGTEILRLTADGKE